ncbi:MAG: hypothetical protein AVDCRST_MAG19-190, partial [uncultured Thermomicrobiales bacterium]
VSGRTERRGWPHHLHASSDAHGDGRRYLQAGTRRGPLWPLQRQLRPNPAPGGKLASRRL